MSQSIIERYLNYIEHDHYRRERRPYRRVTPQGVRRRSAARPQPDTRTLYPQRGDFLYGSRTGMLDRLQGIFGYFFGGGWVFGMVENAVFRATAQPLIDYQNMPASRAPRSLVIEFRAGNANGVLIGDPINLDAGQSIPSQIPENGYMLVRKSIQIGNGTTHLPWFEDLCPIDQGAVIHDLDLRARDEKVWADPAYHGTQDYVTETNIANARLRQRIRKIDWRALERELIAAKSDFGEQFDRVRSAFAYERSLGEFSASMLGLADGDGSTMDAQFNESIIEFGVHSQMLIPEKGDPVYDNYRHIADQVAKDLEDTP